MTLYEIESFLNDWGDGIVAIGTFNNQQDKQKKIAKNFIEKFYGYNDFPVLFAPTKASEKQFRNTFEGALSYFIGNNPYFGEDHGFARTPWKNVRFEFSGINIINDLGIVMGNYFFTDMKNYEVKVEFSFVIKKDNRNNLKIILHHSAFPYSGYGA